MIHNLSIVVKSQCEIDIIKFFNQTDKINNVVYNHCISGPCYSYLEQGNTTFHKQWWLNGNLIAISHNYGKINK
jgi:hypothetical protein